MSERLRSLLAIGVIALSAAVIVAVLAVDSGGGGDRVHALASRLKCPVCTSESIADSPAQVSRDLYDLIGERVADGWSDHEIIDFFVATYGEEALLDPKTSPGTLLLWLAPLALLAVGGLAIAGRRARTGRALTEQEQAMVERALREGP